MFFFLFFTFYVYRIYIFISDLSNNNILWCVHANSPTPTTVQLQDLYHSLNSHNVMIIMTPRFYFIIMHYTSFVLLFSASITFLLCSCVLVSSGDKTSFALLMDIIFIHHSWGPYCGSSTTFRYGARRGFGW